MEIAKCQVLLSFKSNKSDAVNRSEVQSDKILEFNRKIITAKVEDEIYAQGEKRKWFKATEE